MFDVKDIPLAKYTRNEDIANCVTHALGIPFCIVALILLIRLEAGRAPAIRIFAGILYIVSTLIVFTGSADPWVEAGRIPALCKESAIPCFVIPDANHSLETADPAQDILTLQKIMFETEQYMAK